MKCIHIAWIGYIMEVELKKGLPSIYYTFYVHCKRKQAKKKAYRVRIVYSIRYTFFIYLYIHKYNVNFSRQIAYSSFTNACVVFIIFKFKHNSRIIFEEEKMTKDFTFRRNITSYWAVNQYGLSFVWSINKCNSTYFHLIWTNFFGILN